ncbi:MAG: haloacid dehalogenase type II [Steroidobacteraceae bacterium]
MIKLTDFRALTFDCYGTLIDWETGILAALEPLLNAGELTLGRDAVLAEFARQEAAQQAATPGMLYRDLLAQVHRRLAREWQVRVPDALHLAFGASVPRWPVFADTPAALQYLGRHYKLVILSNVDRDSFAGSNLQLGVSFAAVCTAQDIGSYKPDARNFRYLIDAVARLGIERGQILHTAQSLYHDHVPAKAAGLATAWIDRGDRHDGGAAALAPASRPAHDFRFLSLGEMAAAHRAALQ